MIIFLQIWMLFYAILLTFSIMLLVFTYKKDPNVLTANATLDEHEIYKNIDTVLQVDRTFSYFFFIELIIRFVVCPAKQRFVKDWFNIIDVVGIIPWTFIVMLIQTSKKDIKDVLEIHWVAIYIRIAGAIRVIRLLGFARHYMAYRVFLITLWESRREILLLLALYITGATFFAVAAFFAEEHHEKNFHTMASGLWWAMITMSTVGYGDMVPHTALGQIIGVFCAFCGLIATALPVAVIATNYNIIYQTTETRAKLIYVRKTEKDNSRIL